MLDSASKELIHEFIGTRFANGQQATWQAGSVPTTLVTTKSTSVGRPSGLSGALVVLPPFTDPKKVCINVEVMWFTDGGNIGRRYWEVYFRPGEQTLNEAADGVTVNMSGQIYGYIESITAFTAGGAVELVQA